jgi:hypothetical protein
MCGSTLRPCRPPVQRPLQPVGPITPEVEEYVVCDPSAPASIVVEVGPSAAPRGRSTRLILDLGYADDEAAAVVRDLAEGVLSQVATLLTDRGTDLPARLRGALTGLADALAERSAGGATRHRAGHAAGARVAGASGWAGPVSSSA